ncbi:MAG: hypothetical protein ABEK50_04090 [bacterium]
METVLRYLRYLSGTIVVITGLCAAGGWIMVTIPLLGSLFGTVPGTKGLAFYLSLTCMAYASIPFPITYGRTIRTGLVGLSFLFWIPYELQVPARMNIRIDILMLLGFFGLTLVSLGLCWLIDPFNCEDRQSAIDYVQGVVRS